MKGHAPLPSPVPSDALAGSLGILLAGEPVHLLAQHALWWPAQGTLFIADLHLGKAATFRARGIPVPAGTTQGNLDRLSALLQGLPVRRLVVLGDFLHAAQARTRRWKWSWCVATTTAMRATRRPRWASAWWTSPGAWGHSRAAITRRRLLPAMCWPAMSTPPSCCAAPGEMPCACRALPSMPASPCCRPSAFSPAWPACRPVLASSALPWAAGGSGPFPVEGAGCNQA